MDTSKSACFHRPAIRRLASTFVLLAAGFFAMAAHAFDNDGQDAFYNLDIIAADNYYQAQLAANPNDPEANFFRSLTRVLRLFEDGGNAAFQGLLDGFGFSSLGRSLFEFTASPPASLPSNAPSGADVQAFIEDELLVELTAALANLDNLGTGFQLAVPVEGWQALGIPETIPGEIDYGEVKMLQAYLGALQAMLRTFLVAYDWNLDMSVENYSSFQDALTGFPQFLNLVPDGATELVQAKSEWNAAIAAYFAGSSFIRSESDNQADDLITIEAADLAGELAFRTELGEMYCSLDGKPLASLGDPMPSCASSGTPRIGGEAVNLSRVFDNPANLRDLLPALEFDAACGKDYVDTSSLTATTPFPDPTLNGVFPEMTQAELADAGNRLALDLYFDFTDPTIATLYAPTNSTGSGGVLIQLNEGDLPQKPYQLDNVSLQSGSPFGIDVQWVPTRLCGAGWSVWVDVEFNPTEDGGFTDVLVISSNESGEETIEIPIRGCTGYLGDCDGDGTVDTLDACPLDSSAADSNSDGDALCDTRDPDDDNDGTPDASDAFPTDPNEQLDTDGDGIGNNADLDDDGDGVPDLDEIAQGRDPLFNEALAAGVVIQMLLNSDE